jgi:hypothetical protein
MPADCGDTLVSCIERSLRSAVISAGRVEQARYAADRGAKIVTQAASDVNLQNGSHYLFQRCAREEIFDVMSILVMFRGSCGVAS